MIKQNPMSSKHLKIGPYDEARFFLSCPEEKMSQYVDLLKKFGGRKSASKAYGTGWIVPKENQEALENYLDLPSQSRPRYQQAPKTKHEENLAKKDERSSRREGDESSEESESESEEEKSESGEEDRRKSPSPKKGRSRKSPSPKKGRKSPSPKKGRSRSSKHDDEDEDEDEEEIDQLTKKMQELSTRLDKLKRRK